MKIGQKVKRREIWECHNPIHLWFELSYAQYLTIPRSVLQSMSQEWQTRFARCLFELDQTIDWRPKEGRYWCRLKDSKGRFAEDPLGNYRLPIKIKFKELDRKAT